MSTSDDPVQASRHDVVCGRGDQNVSRWGNQRFYEIVDKYRRQYMSARTRYEKTMTVGQIMNAVLPGKFIKKHETIEGAYVVLNEKETRQKICHAIRYRSKHQATGTGSPAQSSFQSTSANEPPHHARNSRPNASTFDAVSSIQSSSATTSVQNIPSQLIHGVSRRSWQVSHSGFFQTDQSTLLGDHAGALSQTPTSSARNQTGFSFSSNSPSSSLMQPTLHDQTHATMNNQILNSMQAATVLPTLSRTSQWTRGSTRAERIQGLASSGNEEGVELRRQQQRQLEDSAMGMNQTVNNNDVDEIDSNEKPTSNHIPVDVRPGSPLFAEEDLEAVLGRREEYH